MIQFNPSLRNSTFVYIGGKLLPEKLKTLCPACKYVHVCGNLDDKVWLVESFNKLGFITFVPISCGVSRGTQLEHIWVKFGMKEVQLFYGTCVPHHTWGAGVWALTLPSCILGEFPKSEDRGWLLSFADWKVLDSSSVLCDTEYPISPINEERELQLCLWTFDILLPFRICICFHLCPPDGKCGTGRLSPCTCLCGNVMLKPMENQISGV